jgi:hypothetical protein
MKQIVFVLLVVLLILVTACSAKNIADIKNEDNIGKTVTIYGTVESSFKIGSLSGYSIKDDSGEIGVSSESLPKEGENITITGVLMKDSIFGYYIKANE